MALAMTWFSSDSYWLTRFAFQRGLALIFLVAFLNALNEFKPLLGERGILPVPLFLKGTSFGSSPSLFFFAHTDAVFTIAAWLGIVASAAALAGISERYTWLSMTVWALMWVLYISFVNVGQIWYAFGWESILLEAGFFAIFLGSASTAPQTITLWLLSWLEFRIMFGAGLIKMRGDECWRNLTCLDYHYETQPMPNPLSWFFHWAPHWTHQGGVLFNHFAELIVPFGYFLPQPVASIAGAITIIFQGLIFASGNLSWLNALTMVLAIPMIDGKYLAHILPLHVPELHAASVPLRVATGALAVLIAILSVRTVLNLISPEQIMNASFNPYHLAGTYGAFGSITRPRYEVIVEGTDEAVITQSTKWKEYGFRGKPGDTGRMPPQIAPYHLRLDWLMWFAALSDSYENPWFQGFLEKLLEGDRAVLGLLAVNPSGTTPPRFVRADLYEYHFTTPAERAKTGQWWKREFVRMYFPPVSRAQFEGR